MNTKKEEQKMLLNVMIVIFTDYLKGADYSAGTITTYLRAMNQFRLYIEGINNGPVYVEDIVLEHLEAFMRYLKEVRCYTSNSRSRHLYTLRSFYEFLVRKGYVNRNLAESLDTIKLPKKERVFLSEKEVYTLADEVSSPLIRLVVLFLFYTGLRISECLSLTMDAADLDRKIIHVWGGKGNKDRLVPINDKLHLLLIDYRDNWRDAAYSDKFFATRKTGGLSQVYINHTLQNTAARLGWKKRVSCHILRHSFASSLVRRNVGLVEIQKLLGHSSLAVTSIYTHANMDQLERAVNTLSVSEDIGKEYTE
jgi:integrase/recombinase XerD